VFAILGPALISGLLSGASVASTGPLNAQSVATDARIASGVVGSLTLRALMARTAPLTPDGLPVFACECTKMTQVVWTERGIRKVPKTFCD
jgi:hypothetical protein